MASLDVDGKICVVTGAGSGLGFETAALLAAAGATVALVCRGEVQATAARDRMVARVVAGQVEGFGCDLSSQRQVRALAERLGDRFPQIDVLLHNAAAVYSERTLSEDGVEMQLAINYLAPFLLCAAGAAAVYATWQSTVGWRVTAPGYLGLAGMAAALTAMSVAAAAVAYGGYRLFLASKGGGHTALVGLAAGGIVSLEADAAPRRSGRAGHLGKESQP